MVGSQLMSISAALPRYRPLSTMIWKEKFVPSVQRRCGREFMRLLKMRTGWKQNGKLGLSRFFVFLFFYFLSRFFEYWMKKMSGLNFIFDQKLVQDVMLQTRSPLFHWTKQWWKFLLIFFDTFWSVLRVISKIPMLMVPICGFLCKIKLILFFHILTDGRVPSKVKCVELQFSQILFPTPQLDMLVSHSWLKEKLVYTSPYRMDCLPAQSRWVSFVNY